MSEKENTSYKKLSYNITREGAKYPFRNDYSYKFSTGQFLEQIDDLSDMSSYTYNEIKQISIDSLVEEFRISLNNVVFGDPAGKEYVEYLKTKKMNSFYWLIPSLILFVVITTIDIITNFKKNG